MTGGRLRPRVLVVTVLFQATAADRLAKIDADRFDAAVDRFAERLLGAWRDDDALDVLALSAAHHGARLSWRRDDTVRVRGDRDRGPRSEVLEVAIHEADGPVADLAEIPDAAADLLTDLIGDRPDGRTGGGAERAAGEGADRATDGWPIEAVEWRTAVFTGRRYARARKRWLFHL